MRDQIRSAQIVLPCANLNRTLEFFTERLGFSVEMIFPADSPSTAVISGFGLTLRLENSEETPATVTLRLLCDTSSLGPENPREIYSPDGVKVILTEAESNVAIPESVQEFILTPSEDKDSWGEGRAGMQYRDLIPGRLGGKFIASHIRIPGGGEVPDYVHYHKIRFQMIYCISGWTRLVYESQGLPFVLNAGDCVLQPPEIRHRVLEASHDLEVLEVGCPAIHETFADHSIRLPDERLVPDRVFNGQRFVRHVADKALWENSQVEGFQHQDTGISEATNGLADVRVLRAISESNFSVNHAGEFLFYFVLKGNLKLVNSNKPYSLRKGAGFVLPAGEEYFINAESGLEVLQVRMPAG